MIERLRRGMGGPSYLCAWKEGQCIPVERVIDDAIELIEKTYQPRTQDRKLSEVEGLSVALSQRECQVIGLVAEGLSIQEIGERLFITE